MMLIVSTVPPLAAFAVAEVVAGDLLNRIGMGNALLVASAVAVVWAGIVAVAGARFFTAETKRLVELAERGAAETSDPEEPGAARRRLTAALDERNSQIAELAARSRQIAISAHAPTVVRSMVDATRSITGDPTWSLAIMRSLDEGRLPVGLYGSEGDPGRIEDVHRWATTLEPETEDSPGVHHATGPWGAFVVVDVASSDEVRAAFVSPREGRSIPSRAERDLLGLVGQHAGIAIEHSLLYGRVRQQADELNRLTQLQADFLRGVSHDLQTPLTSIRALAEEVQAAPALPDTARADLDAIRHQADRLRRMVAQLLAMSRLEAGALAPRSDVFRVEPLVERTWEALRADRPFELVRDGEAYLAVGDPDRFEQALWAILDNALKYSPAGSPVRVRVSASERELAVEVKDIGIGMLEGTRARAFDQFYREPNARRMAPDGSGIGLYTARGLLRAMGGDIELASDVGRGTTARLTLPAEPARQT